MFIGGEKVRVRAHMGVPDRDFYLGTVSWHAKGGDKPTEVGISFEEFEQRAVFSEHADAWRFAGPQGLLPFRRGGAYEIDIDPSESEAAP